MNVIILLSYNTINIFNLLEPSSRLYYYLKSSNYCKHKCPSDSDITEEPCFFFFLFLFLFFFSTQKGLDDDTLITLPSNCTRNPYFLTTLTVSTNTMTGLPL